MVKIFLVGATGHIGGAVLDLVSKAYPEAILTALIRDKNKAAQLTAKYPQITTDIGDLESFALLELKSSESDVVINTAPDVTHEAGIAAIIKGLSSRLGAGKGKGFYIQTSGAALIWDQPDGSKPGTKVWDDVGDIDKILSIPDDTIHRSTDKLVFEASDSINVAIISPVAVYGLSPSPCHPFPLTLPEVLNAIRSLSSGFTISSGLNLQGYIHVLDIARLYLLLLSHAIDPSPYLTDQAVWGPEAYYFAAGEEVSFVNFMAKTVEVLKAKGILDTCQLKRIDVGEAAVASGAAKGMAAPDSWATHIAVMFGVDMRVMSTRGRKLGWKLNEARVLETLHDVMGRYLEREEVATVFG